MSDCLKVVASEVENVALFNHSTAGDSLLIDTNGNSNLYKDVNIGGNVTSPSFTISTTFNTTFNTFLNGLTKVVNTNSFTQFGSLDANTSKWIGGVLAPNGKIYGIPFNYNKVLVIDPVDNSTTEISDTLTGSWSGGVLAPNGKIYGIPWSSTKVLVIDPVANSANTTDINDTLDDDVNKWWGGVLAPNGKIYGIPSSASTILEIDPVAKTATTFGTTSGSFAGGILAPNGKIYGIPYSATTILEIIPYTQYGVNNYWMLKPYFNKF